MARRRRRRKAAPKAAPKKRTSRREAVVPAAMPAGERGRKTVAARAKKGPATYHPFNISEVKGFSDIQLERIIFASSVRKGWGRAPGTYDVLAKAEAKRRGLKFKGGKASGSAKASDYPARKGGFVHITKPKRKAKKTARSRSRGK